MKDGTKKFVATAYVKGKRYSVVVTLDVQKLVDQVAEKAVRNKSGKTKLAHGSVQVSVAYDPLPPVTLATRSG